MRSLGVLLRHPIGGAAIRYALAGAAVAGVYLGTPLMLNGVLGVPIQIAIAVAYVLAVTLHFNLQRHFVFGHVDRFALSPRQQISRYILIGAIQYPTTALAIAFLPGLLGVSERLVFVTVTLCISATLFLVLRVHVFHPSAEEDLGSATVRRGAAATLMADSSAASRKQPDLISS
jgi:putative flippase GtrA